MTAAAAPAKTIPVILKMTHEASFHGKRTVDAVMAFRSREKADIERDRLEKLHLKDTHFRVVDVPFTDE